MQQTPQALHVLPNHAPDNKDQVVLASRREKWETEAVEVSLSYINNDNVQRMAKNLSTILYHGAW